MKTIALRKALTHKMKKFQKSSKRQETGIKVCKKEVRLWIYKCVHIGRFAKSLTNTLLGRFAKGRVGWIADLCEQVGTR